MLKLLTCARGHFWESADEGSICPECGAGAEALPLLDLAPTAPVSAPATHNDNAPIEANGRPIVAGYDILEELAKGPTGIRRYRAKQQLVNREVMLEVVLAREDSSQRAWSSLRSEAGLLGKLQHPHIVEIHEAGDRDRQLFFNVLELIDGPTLAHKATDAPVPVEQALALVETLALAVEHAHRRDVLHRHLEPASILLQHEPGGKTAIEQVGGASCLLSQGWFIPRIVGFGLARRPIEGDPTDAELYADPGYLAPEQAWGRTRELGRQTDVYGLGGILYFLLTGRAPFRGPTLGDVIDAIQTAPLIAPSDVRRVPRDVEFLCRKALARHPRQRYASAADFAVDLRRVALGMPPREGPRGSPIARWVRRSPMAAALVVLAVIGAGGTILGYQRGQRDGKTADVTAYHARAELGRTQVELKSLQSELTALRQRERFTAYKQKLDRVGQALASNNPLQARILLDSCAIEERRFEWHHLQQRIASRDRIALPIGDATVTAAVYHPRDRRYLVLATASGGTAELQLWDVGRPRKVFTHPLAGGRAQALAFSPSGHQVAAVGGKEGTLVLLDLLPSPRQLRQRARTSLGNEPLTSVAYHPYQHWVNAASGSGQLYSVDLNHGRLLRKQDRPLRASEGGVPRTAMAHRKDGQLLATFTTGDADVKLWISGTDSFHLSIRGPGSVTAMAFGGDRLLAIARSDDSIRMHDSQTGQEVGRIENLPRTIRQLAFSAEGTRLAVACENSPIKVFGASARVWFELLDIMGDGTTGLAFSPTGQLLVAASSREALLFGSAE